MQYTTLGATGLIVSRLGFGAATFTQGNRTLSTLYKVEAELAAQLVERCINAGVNFFDTSDVYADGESETLLGAALKPHRDKVIITTKVGNRGTTDRDLLHGNLSRRQGPLYRLFQLVRLEGGGDGNPEGKSSGTVRPWADVLFAARPHWRYQRPDGGHETAPAPG